MKTNKNRANRIAVKAMTAVMVTGLMAAGAGCSLSLNGKGDSKVYELDKTEIEAWDTLDLDIPLSNVEIIPTDGEFAIEYSMINVEPSYEIRDGVLTITADEKSRTVGLNTTDIKFYMNLYVPSDVVLESMDMELNLGNIEIGNITVNELTLEANCGNIEINNTLIMENLIVESDLGNVEVSLPTSVRSYNLEASLGAVDVNGNSNSGTNIRMTESAVSEEGPAVRIEAACGNIELEYA